MKKILVLFISSIILNCSYGQQSLNEIPLKFTIKNEDRAKVDQFKKEEALSIYKHRENMKIKRQTLNEKETKLLNEITESKNNGNLTFEQKEYFKREHINIKKQSQELNQLNEDFLKKLQEKRTNFYLYLNK